MKVVCINDSDKPIDIPEHKWVKKDEIYTIAKVVKLNLQTNALGVELEEIDLIGCFPYEYFLANRFAPLQPEKSLQKELEGELEIENTI